MYKTTKPSPNSPAVAPIGLAAALLIICLLASLAVPRLRAVSAERGRPAAPRVLSAYESPRLSVAVSDTCGGRRVGGVGAWWSGR